MISEEKISNRVEIVEYNGENRPLFFDFILASSTTPKGLTSFQIKNMGIGLTSDNFKITSGTTTYTAPPSVTIAGGGGTGATAVAVLDSSKLVKSIEISNPGQGYTSAPTMTFSGGTVATAGTNPVAVGVFVKSENFIDLPSSLDPYIYVWIDGKGAYLTQDENKDWLYLEDLTAAINKINTIYTTNSNGQFLVNNNAVINDRFNQIRELTNGKGYIIVNGDQTKLPYVWYKYFPRVSSSDTAKIAFNITKCYVANKQSLEFIDNTAKAIKLGQQGNGSCMKDYSATISVVIDLVNLQKNTDYHIHLESLSREVLFIEQDIYLNNNQLSNHSVYAKLKFLENNVNNIFDIQATVNIGNNEVDRDILSIYVDCPEPPKPTPTPRPAQPIIRIVE
jgi:hypothetical protein